MNILVPISYFRGLPRSEIWLLDTLSGHRDCVFYSEPSVDRAVSGKGITGLAWLNNNQLVACDFNQLWSMERSDFSVVKSLQDSQFNDLHHIGVKNSRIYVSNTGRDSIDVLCPELTLNERNTLISRDDLSSRIIGDYHNAGVYYDSPAGVREFYRRKLPDTYHVNHSVVVDTRLLVTSFKKRCLIDAVTCEAVSNVLPDQPHDGFIYQGNMWITTVSGKIYRSELSFPLQFQLVFDLFSQSGFLGWCRGLTIIEDKLFIGITQVQERSERSLWLIVAPEETRTGIYQLNLETGDIEAFYDFTAKDGSRIFSLVDAH